VGKKQTRVAKAFPLLTTGILAPIQVSTFVYTDGRLPSGNLPKRMSQIAT
jgi:hypothetical protein